MQSSTVYSNIAFRLGPLVTSTPHFIRNFWPVSEVWIVPLIFGHSTTVVGVALVELDPFEDVFEAEEVDIKADVGDGVVLRREEAAVAELVTAPAEEALLLPIFSSAISPRCTRTREAYPAGVFELVLFFFDASAPPIPPPTAITSTVGLKPHSLLLRSTPDLGSQAFPRRLRMLGLGQGLSLMIYCEDRHQAVGRLPGNDSARLESLRKEVFDGVPNLN